jgi:TctA family transporter
MPLVFLLDLCTLVYQSEIGKRNLIGLAFFFFNAVFGFSFFRHLNFTSSYFFPLLSPQVISLGDVIKFSLSPSKSIDRLSTNVSGVPLTEDNLVRHE